jgi:radical SAM superfamily enzyme YgiQ (UPF0313 family)
MKVLLVNLPWSEGFNRFSRWSSKSVSRTFSEPLLLAYSTAVAEKETTAEVKLVDALAEGWNWRDFESYINKFRPDITVIETSTPSFENDKKSFKIIKKSGSKLMMVGTHSSVFPIDVLKKYPVDIVGIGEFDYTVADVINNINSLNKVKGIAYKMNKKVIVTKSRSLIENLDELPFPARHHLDMSKYRESNTTNSSIARILSSRGCTGRCIFCVWNSVLFQKRFRARSAKNVINEIDFLIDKYGVKYIYIDDDTFTIDKKRVFEICDLMKKKKINKKISWGTLSRVDTIDAKLLKAMKEAGCDLIVYGIESGSQDILNKMKKGITLDIIREIVKETKKNKIRVHATFMFGAPGETKETIRKTIDFAKELDPDTAQFPICMPYPGTEFFDMAVKHNWLKIKDWSNFHSATDEAVIEYDDLKKEDLENAVKTAYKEFYMRPKYIVKQTLKIRSIQEFVQLIQNAYFLIKSLGGE